MREVNGLHSGALSVDLSKLREQSVVRNVEKVAQRGLTRMGLEIRRHGEARTSYPGYREGLLNQLEIESANRHVAVVGIGAGFAVEDEPDPLGQFLLRNETGVQALLIEPQPERAAALEAMFGRHRHVSVREVAVTVEPGASALQLHRVTTPMSERIARATGAANGGRAWTSVDRGHVIRHVAATLGVSRQEATTGVEAFDVPARAIDELLEAAGFTGKIDYMQTDAEGFDAQVLLSLDLARFGPGVISFEHMHLPDDDRSELSDYLGVNRYEVFKIDDENSAAVRAG